ncbi:hypothetical protein BFJ70_g2580 [Fusarium oxysporum]|uniref:Uncharacterized protein n=1 Tax=Fusarium oxysporum f. sp. cepae TaxID=396571 RepID=A0A3L6N9V1_FUSOX|nr:hypothetical protein BFJ65_g11057 [Fusarium oxysporum f. sp. cepae]RKL48224.1 hypothetical protein BFJ70_g2580 [Fusarium oxysporum]
MDQQVKSQKRHAFTFPSMSMPFKPASSMTYYDSSLVSGGFNYLRIDRRPSMMLLNQTSTVAKPAICA